MRAAAGVEARDGEYPGFQRVIDCRLTVQLGVYIAEEPIEATEGEGVVVAIDPSVRPPRRSGASSTLLNVVT